MGYARRIDYDPYKDFEEMQDKTEGTRYKAQGTR
jgi:hypothetical protein